MSKSVTYLFKITQLADPDRRCKYLILTLCRKKVAAKLEQITKQYPDSKVEMVKIDTKHRQMFMLWVEMTFNSANAGTRIAALRKIIDSDKQPLDVDEDDPDSIEYEIIQ